MYSTDNIHRSRWVLIISYKSWSKCFDHTKCKYLWVCFRVCVRMLYAQTGPIDLLRVVAAVVMVTEEDKRKISNLQSLETCWRCSKQARTHKQYVTQSVFKHKLHLNKSEILTGRTSKSLGGRALRCLSGLFSMVFILEHFSLAC